MNDKTLVVYFDLPDGTIKADPYPPREGYQRYVIVMENSYATVAAQLRAAADHIDALTQTGSAAK